jgi:hypothetical protein
MLPDDEQIRQRAYEIWEREGRPEGREADHWRMAAEELSAQRAGADTQEVPATRVRGPAQLDQTPSQPSGMAASAPAEARPADEGYVPAAPSPDPQSDPLGLAQPTAKAAPRKRNSAGRNSKRARPNTSSPTDADADVPDRTR